MIRDFSKILTFPLIVFFISGCATTRPKRLETQDPQSQITTLQTQLQAKDQEIQDLHAQLESGQQSLSNNFASSVGSDKLNLLRVPGVSAMDVQQSLLKAGFDPGPADGRLGKKTRKAIKAFQRKHHLTVDGVVGDKTWSVLRSYY